MSPRVSISRKSAEALREVAQNLINSEGGAPWFIRAFEELCHALAPAPKRSIVAHAKRTRAKKRNKKEETAEIRAAVMKRADGRCELCGHGPGSNDYPLELHHVFGRVRMPQSERNCIAVCRGCHRGITDNNPTAAYWGSLQFQHLTSQGYIKEAAALERRMAMVEAKARMGEVAP